MNLMNVLNGSYWTDTRPPPLWHASKIGYWIFLGLVLVAWVGLRLAMHRVLNNPPLRKFLKEIVRPLLGLGMVELLYYFFRQEGVSVLSMRLVSVLIFLGFASWGIYITQRFIRSYQTAQDAHRRRRVYERYLPKSR